MREPAQPKRVSTSYNITVLSKYHAKCSRPDSRASFCACAGETHFDVIQHHDCAVNTAQNAPEQTRGPHFARACAIETTFDIIQQRATCCASLRSLIGHHDFAVNATQNARSQAGRLHLAPGLYSYRKNPSASFKPPQNWSRDPLAQLQAVP